MQISKLQTTSSEQKQACRPTGAKNYMLAEVFFPFFFPSLILSYPFLEIKHTGLPPHRHRTVQNLLLFFFFSNETQAYRHTGMIKPPAGRLTNINEQVQAH